MNQCYPIVLLKKRDYEFIGICFDPKNKNMIINQNKNKRWLNESKNLPFNDWILNDEAEHKILQEVPFYGDVKNSECVLLTNYDRIIGAYVNESDFYNLVDEYNLTRWKNWIYYNYEQQKNLYFNFLPLNSYINIYPLDLSVIDNVKIYL